MGFRLQKIRGRLLEDAKRIGHHSNREPLWLVFTDELLYHPVQNVGWAHGLIPVTRPVPGAETIGRPGRPEGTPNKPRSIGGKWVLRCDSCCEAFDELDAWTPFVLGSLCCCLGVLGSRWNRRLCTSVQPPKAPSFPRAYSTRASCKCLWKIKQALGDAVTGSRIRNQGS